MKRFSILRPFQVKVTIALILAMIFPLLLNNLIVYKFTSDSTLQSLRSQLKLIAQLAAEIVDPQLLLEVPLNRRGVESSQYQMIAAKLKKIKQISPQVKYIYILKKTDQPGLWQFVVDPEPAEKKNGRILTSFPGDKYQADRFPEMMQAFFYPTADEKLQTDEWGTTLSGYAPVFDQNGTSIAVLGVDVMADDVYRMQQEVKRRTIFVFAIGLCLCLLLGMVISNRITDPVEKLVEATRKIAKGDLSHQIKFKGDDELSELAGSFNLMSKSLKESRRRLIGYFYNTVRTLVRILEVKDHYTRGHSEAVARYSAKIAAKMGFPKQTVKLFRRMTLLHDIGKLGIKDEILNKVKPLTPEEWLAIKRHPLLGENFLQPILKDDDMLTVVKEHHERQDGKGYPRNLTSEQISIFASIVSVADAFSAMTSDRSYRRALSREAAVVELKKHAGTQFHPQVLEIFLEILKEERAAKAEKK